MAVITGTQYHAIAEQYAAVSTALDGVTDALYGAVYDIVLFNTYEPTLDLMDTFNSVYTANLNNNGLTNSLLPAVSKINNHVIARGGYASVDAFLTATGATVPQAWADLCTATGTTISGGNIAG